MLRNYVLITLRNLTRNKVFILINTLGMGIAIACCIVAYLNWNFSANFDSHHANRETIYRVQSWHNTPDGNDRYAVTPTALGSAVRENIHDVDRVVRFTNAPGNVRIGDEVFNTDVAYADSAFFDLFTFNLADGTFDAFHNKSMIFISEDLARKYFNATNVAGRQITQINHGHLKEFTVGGVFQPQPLNSSFGFDAITLWDNYWDTTPGGKAQNSDWKDMTTLFVQILDPLRIKAVTQQLQSYLEPQHHAREDFRLSEYYLENFKTMAAHFYGDTWLNGEQLRWGIPPSAVLGPGFMAIFLLLLACFNFTNTSLAISGRRLKEIGIRKTMGGIRSQLIFQFLNESVILCFLALLVGLLLAAFLVPAYNSMWPGIKLAIQYAENVFFFTFLLGLLLITALLAGTYPAFYITSFKPATILKGKMKFGGTNWFTRTLLTFQFSIALMCIVTGFAFIRNAQYQRDYDLGYAKEGVITAPIGSKKEFEAFRNALDKNSAVEAIAGSRNHVSDRYEKGTVKYESAKHAVEIVDVGDDYLNAMNVRVIAGRAFKKDSETDKKESILVSAAFQKQYGWKDAIGKKITWMDTINFYVVGVVKDIHTEGFWKPVAPVMLRYVDADQYTQIVVRTSPQKVAEVNAVMKEAWKKISPNSLYRGTITDGNIYAAEMINKNTVGIFGFLGIIAVLMSATGLYALVSLNILKKMKEIGVRKMLGASGSNIARVINQEFFIILSVASLFGGGLGFVISDKLMDAIWEYYLQLGIVTISVAILVLFVVAILTVGYKTIVTTRSNPIHALRDE